MAKNADVKPGDRMKEARRKRGWTQRELAQAVESTTVHIARIEAGAETCRLDLALRIAAVLELD